MQMVHRSRSAGVIKAWLASLWGLRRGLGVNRVSRSKGEAGGEQCDWFRVAGEALAHGAGGICLAGGVEVRDG